MLVGCGEDRIRKDFVADLFQELNFAGELSSSAPVPQNVNRSPLIFPTEFIPGKVYVFQPRVPIQLIEFAKTTLPNRLRKQGALVVLAPTGIDDMAIPNMGGPIWEIRFQMGKTKGWLYNRFNFGLQEAHPNWPSGSHENYMLSIDP